ncbi:MULTISPECIES: tripartite tricarboxylate transporter TctB family protein [Halomonas]|uniref:tripartite tricarboxylate transporter TctB family protein n=1 Tax=Halomonas TaxID=2745 RepID=UPI000ECECE58|nr:MULTISPECIES: tripartite tricarboxylate transporter TctB family protein [Halomonas]HCR98935.1 tripartite tricarboxylate transporter TctB family protein [Halomonas sp.]
MSDDIEQRPEAVAKKSIKDAMLGGGIFVASVLFAWIVIPAGVVSPASVERLPLSPVFLPYVLTTLIGIFGLIYGMQASIGLGVPKEENDESTHLRRRWPLHILLVAACFFAYCFLTQYLGMLLISIMVTGFLIWLGGERRPLILVSVSIGLPLVLYLFFTLFAQVPLPKGLLEGWI